MSMTFRQLDAGADRTRSADYTSLESWYQRVRDVPISDMSIDDLCRACRQNVHLVQVLPVVLRHLRCEPMTGEMFDGELASVTARIPAAFWRENQDLARMTRDVLGVALVLAEADVRVEIEAFLSKTAGLN